MQRIAQFFKVSYEEFEKGMKDIFRTMPEEEIEKLYWDIKLPKRATTGSAGYDFYTPFSFTLQPGETIKIPTGIRAKMDENWVLKLYPRSGLGFKFRLQLNNTVGIIDSDYFNSDNEGHIFAKITNDSNEEKVLSLEKGAGFMQGIFLEYGITVDDEADGVRNGVNTSFLRRLFIVYIFINRALFHTSVKSRIELIEVLRVKVFLNTS